MKTNKYSLGEIPFIIGTNSIPSNQHNLPDLLPFSYYLDRSTNVIKQSYDENIDKYLQVAYGHASHPGTPMDEQGEGAGYLFDFFSFIEQSIPNLNEKTILEIGCGKGFLLKLLQDKKAKVMGVEPGENHSHYWKKNNVNVINDFFPSQKIKSRFDLIIAYAVLEHINDAEKFVTEIRNHLYDNGRVILAVPNCEDQLNNCDPSLFVHEHYSYFSKESLARFLELSGFKINNVTYAGYGGSIYIDAQKSETLEKPQYESADFNIEHFADEVNRFKSHLDKQARALKEQNKTLGVYCPGRAVTSISITGDYRFFDDDKNIHNQFFPPFPCPIENREDLIDNPVDVLWIFSYSFGDKIKSELLESTTLSRTKILTLSELKKASKKDE